MKKEFEDLAFPAIDPDAYAHAVEVRKLKRKENEVGLAKVQKSLQHTLARRGLREFKTEIRVKGLWSLHQKLKRKGDDITRIHDIAALRVIVKSIDDCYQVLGVVHGNWKPLPGEFKDYIAFPKPNGYQSLHTTVLTSEAGVVEIQIRTEDMHQRAQFGIASHMSYKHLGKGVEQRQAGTQRRAFEKVSMTWIRDLIPGLLNFSRKPANAKAAVPAAKGKKQTEQPQWLNELADAHVGSAESSEFVEGLKADFFSHRVFVFTPGGDVIDLPVSSTPIDFAYAIHSELGNHMHGAKVNGKLVTFDTVLRNGDIVEILERQNAKPTAKWAEYARTSMARRHIRNAIEAENIRMLPQAEAKAVLAAKGPTPRKVKKRTPKK